MILSSSSWPDQIAIRPWERYQSRDRDYSDFRFNDADFPDLNPPGRITVTQVSPRPSRAARETFQSVPTTEPAPSAGGTIGQSLDTAPVVLNSTYCDNKAVTEVADNSICSPLDVDGDETIITQLSPGSSSVQEQGTGPNVQKLVEKFTTNSFDLSNQLPLNNG